MGEVIFHRGPDAGGEYLDEWIGLAHRRLSIIDLSPDGNQPMFSNDGRYVIVFNGEIYNFSVLREKLIKSGVVFRSRTDTEVILAMYASFGTACLREMNGMFAFAVWDKVEKKLFLARDRIGKKPLYYLHCGSDRLAFASEIKSLLQLPGVQREIEPTAIADFLKYLYIPAPKTIFKGIYKLLPGYCLELRVGSEPVIDQYWDVEFSGRADVSLEDAAEELAALIRECTACRMIADVPLGAFLSGGIDSSAVVALMAQASAGRVKTCSIGFPDKRHDETMYAREIANLFNTEHTEYTVREDLAGTVSVLPKYFDEPFADSSAVPTFHVSRLARRKVTVALAGDGGDENFGGYEKYTKDSWEDNARKYMPVPLLDLFGRIARARSGIIMRKFRTLVDGALADPARAYYWTNTFIGDGELNALLAEGIRSDINGYDAAWHTTRYWNKIRGADHVACMLYTDVKSFLPGDILVKVDRMSMAHSLEVRAPLLDHRIIEFAANLPSRWKIKGGSKKYILKKAFRHVLPDGILKRRKHGFTVPLDEWFRNDLHSLTEISLIRDTDMNNYFDPATIRGIWREHQDGRRNHGTLLWSLLSFALWHREYMI